MFFEVCNGDKLPTSTAEIPCKFNGWNFGIPKRNPGSRSVFLCHLFPVSCFILGVWSWRYRSLSLPGSEASSWKFGPHLEQWNMYGSFGLHKGFYNSVFNGDCKNTFTVNLYHNVFFLSLLMFAHLLKSACFFLFPFPVVRLNMYWSRLLTPDGGCLGSKSDKIFAVLDLKIRIFFWLVILH